MPISTIKNVLIIPLCFIAIFSAGANTPKPSSALEYQQTTSTRIVVEENHLRFFTGGSERMTIDESGNLGIGTISPTAKLEVKNSGVHKSDLLVHSTAVGGWSRISLKREDDPNEGFLSYFGNSSSGMILGVEGLNPIRFYNNGQENLRILANGNVGIGTANPEAKFHVKEVVNLYSGKNVGSYTIGSTTGTLYEIAGTDSGGDNSNQSQGGYGIVRGANQISPVIWMYAFGGKNAFQVKRKGWNSTVQSGATLFHVETSGNVGIGTTSPSYKLHVNGEAYATRYKAPSNAAWPDYVFEDAYQLNKLDQVEKYIEENHHLPEIPSAAEVAANGIDLVDMQAKLLQKIEELTLYVIEQNKRIEEQQERIEKLESQ